MQERSSVTRCRRPANCPSRDAIEATALHIVSGVEGARAGSGRFEFPGWMISEHGILQFEDFVAGQGHDVAAMTEIHFDVGTGVCRHAVPLDCIPRGSAIMV